MRPLGFFSRSVCTLASTVATIAIPFATHCEAGPSNDAKALVADVVELVDNQYFDESRFSSDWQKWRQTLLTTPYADEDSAQADIVRALGALKDPYTYFLTPSEFEALQNGVSGEVADIGIKLEPDDRDRPAVSATPLLGSPAFFSGIHPGDVIVAVDGQSTKNWTIGDTIRNIQGKENSRVTLTLLRSGEQLEIELARADLSLPTVSYAIQEHDNRQVGYIRLTRFDDRAIREMRQAIKDLESRSVDAYILDLRSNPGGLLNASTKIAEMFLDGGTIVTLEDRDRVRRIVDRQKPLTDKPLAVLVNGGSASSSEVLAGALHDAQRATLVGTQTFGKGVVQMLYMLPDESCLAVTTASYRTPSGHNLHRRGLVPDIRVEITDRDRELLAVNRSEPISPIDPQYSAAVDSLLGTVAANEIALTGTSADSSELAMTESGYLHRLN